MIIVNLNSRQWDVHSCHLTPSSPKQILSPGKSFALSVYISLLILSHSYTNQENLKIKWWKYRSKELLKPFPFCHQKKLDCCCMNFFSNTTQVCSRCLNPLSQDQHALTGFSLLSRWGGSTWTSQKCSHPTLHQGKFSAVDSSTKAFISVLNNNFHVI